MLFIKMVFLLMIFDVAMVVETFIRFCALCSFMTHFVTLGAFDLRLFGRERRASPK